MPPAQVLLVHIAGVNDEYRDDLYKGAYLPTAQALPVLQAAEKRLRSAPDAEATRIPRYLLSAVPRVVIVANRVERRIAALRVLEAVRLGWGAGDLPCFVGDVTRELTRAFPGEKPGRLDIWLIVHADVQRTSRVRILVDELARVFREGAILLAGGASV